MITVVAKRCQFSHTDRSYLRQELNAQDSKVAAFLRTVAADEARVTPARFPGIPNIPDPNSKPFAAGFLATGPPEAQNYLFCPLMRRYNASANTEFCY